MRDLSGPELDLVNGGASAAAATGSTAVAAAVAIFQPSMTIFYPSGKPLIHFGGGASDAAVAAGVEAASLREAVSELLTSS